MAITLLTETEIMTILEANQQRIAALKLAVTTFNENIHVVSYAADKSFSSVKRSIARLERETMQLNAALNKHIHNKN